MKYYIPISRRLFEHPFWCENRTFSKFEAWLDVLQSARFENSKQLVGNRLIEVKRGQFPVSLRFLAGRWGWSTKKVNSFLDCLMHDKMIAKKTHKETGQTIITICNYDKYNSNSDERKQGKKQEGNGKKDCNRINKKQVGNSEETVENVATICKCDDYISNVDSEETAKKRKENGKETAGKQQGNKYNKENKEDNIILPNPSFFGFDLSFVPLDFLDAFKLWLDYKKDRREKYKSEKSLKLCLNNLVKLSNNNPSLALEIVNQSIASNWAGLFELKNNGNKEQKNNTDRLDTIIRTADL